jgi:hypothetical protein
MRKGVNNTSNAVAEACKTRSIDQLPVAVQR